MKRSITGVIIAIIVLGAIGLIITRRGTDNTRQSTPGSTNQTDSRPANESQQQNEANQSQPTNTDKAEIKDFAFTPAKITVKKGTTVTWTNQDGARHDVTPDQPSEKFKASQLLAKGETYSFTFNDEGTYTYHCSPHPYMKGTVEVVSD